MSLLRWVAVLFVLLQGLAYVAVTDGDVSTALRVYGLRCEGRENPLGIESERPVLSWNSESSRRGMLQTAYQVLAASRPELLVAAIADVWDSGKVESAAQRIAYDGRGPTPVERIFWTVRIWDNHGEVSEWAAPASWIMGEMYPDTWKANWIAGEEPAQVVEEAKWIWIAEEDFFNAAVGTARFTRFVQVKTDTELLSATFYIAADNQCDIYVNQQKCRHVTGYSQSSVVDVTQLLRSGDNLLELMVTNASDVPNPAGVFARLDIEYADGGIDRIVTDRGWRGSRVENDASEAETAPEAQELGPWNMGPWNMAPVARQPLPLFRKTFHVADTPLRYAVMHVCGLGHFEAFMNGEKVGDHVLDPGWTDYKDTCLYVPFDVTDRLRPGMNACGIMLGNGLYNVIGGRYTKFTGSFGEPKLIAQLHLVYEDGSRKVIPSDNSWTTHKGPIVFSCAYGGEDYDARLEVPGWNTAEFSAAAWRPARVTDGPGGVLRAQQATPIKVMDTLQTASIKQTAPGSYEADMGFNLSARPVITVKGDEGDTVTVRVGERPGMPWEGHWYTYTLRGNGEETYTPFFTYFGFQYITVEGVDRPDDADGARPVLLNLASEFVTSASQPVGSFSCDNPLLNEIDAMITRSVRSNLQSVLTDCPHREKLGWLEVAHLMGPSILYRFDAYGLYAKICRDTTESQLENGLVPDIAPEYTRFNAGFFESPEWGSAAVQLPWLLYRWYGDIEILARQYSTMARYTRYLASTRNAQGLAKAGLGDWYDWTPEKGHVGYAQLTPGELTATAMLFDNARIMSRVTTLTGHERDTKTFEDLAWQVREDFITAYYDSEQKTVATGSQAALAMALYFGLIPEEAEATVLAKLVDTLEADGYKPSTGEVCFRYMIMALARAGRSDIVYQIINRTDCPGYGWMLREFGLQTLSECWDKPGSSLNHCMFGHAQEWFQAYVLGIRQTGDSIGFENLVIAPEVPDGLQEAKGHFDSPRGPIYIDWEKEKATFLLSVTIPGNTSATVVLPVPADATLTESGTPLEQAGGIEVFERNEGECRLKVGSGTYQFHATRYE